MEISCSAAPGASPSQYHLAHPETRLRFHEATDLTHELLESPQHTVRSRVLRHLRRHGLLEPPDAEDMLAWNHGGGFSLDGSVRIEATDRTGLERLIRSVTSTFPAELPDGLVGDHGAPLREEFFDVAKAQGEPMVQPDDMADDLTREPVAVILVRSRLHP